MNITSARLTNPVYNQQKYNNQTNIKTNNSFINDKFQPSFKGYEKTLKYVANKPIQNEKNVEESFKIIFAALKHDPSITKSEGFDTIAKLYKKKGLRSVLHEFWRANQSKEMDKIMPKEMDMALTIAEKDGKPVMQVINWGKFGILYNKNAPNNMRLSFLTKDDQLVTSLDFGLNKNGEYITEQLSKTETTTKEFYRETGTVKTEIDMAGYKTYYNKDGSENFLKSFFFGGQTSYIY